MMHRTIDKDFLNNDKKIGAKKIMEAVYQKYRESFSFKEFLLITLGTIIVSIGIYFFKFPNHFSTGGVAGLAVVIPKIFNITAATATLFLNLFFLVLGFVVFGSKFGFKTTYASILLSLVILLLERLIPLNGPLTNEPLLELFFAVLLPGIGSAILFNTNASSGGTDVMAMIIKKFTNVEIGNALLLGDLLITLSVFFAFDVRTGLFSLLGLMTKSLIVNQAIESFNMVKYFTIITDKPNEIARFAMETLHRGVTSVKGEGKFTHEDKHVLHTVVKRSQAVLLRDEIKKLDPHAFVMITNTSQIIGKGFNLG